MIGTAALLNGVAVFFDIDSEDGESLDDCMYSGDSNSNGSESAKLTSKIKP